MVLDYVALVLLVIVVLVLFYGIILIHDIPYEIAKERNHPHSDVIHVAGWVSLFTLHVIWPFLWIWATLYHEEKGWGMDSASGNPSPALGDRFDALERRIAQLEQPGTEG